MFERLDRRLAILAAQLKPRTEIRKGLLGHTIITGLDGKMKCVPRPAEQYQAHAQVKWSEEREPGKGSIDNKPMEYEEQGESDEEFLSRALVNYKNVHPEDLLPEEDNCLLKMKDVRPGIYEAKSINYRGAPRETVYWDGLLWRHHITREIRLFQGFEL